MNLIMNKFLLLIFSLLLLPASVFAVNLEVVLEKNTINQGEFFSATIFLNTEGELINAIEGDLKYDSKLLSIENINTGASFVNFWVEKPEKKTPGTVHFSGITPGGITTNKGEVFKIIFRANAFGQASLVLNNVSLFLNDGQGSYVKTNINNTSIQINKGSGEVKDFLVSDTVAPESFSLSRSKDQGLFDNKYFIAFSTTDKGSGVDHYKVCEVFYCYDASSPYLLKNQTPFYHISVKAYDVNNNMTSSSITSTYFILLSVFVLLLIFYLIFHFFFKKL